MPTRAPYKPEFNEAKFRELLIYIAKKSETDPKFGAVKLNKILYYSDFIAYRRLGKPITGATYQKLGEGPAPREILRIRRIMITEGIAEIRHVPYFNGVQQRLVLLGNRTVNREVFEPGELEIVDEVMENLLWLSARDTTEMSHQEPGWIASRYGAVIPYETAWLSADPLPQEAEEYGQALAKRSRR